MKPPALPDGLSPFQRMRAIARRVVGVSKAELDKREAEYQRQRKRRKR